MALVILARHGRTEANATGVLAGWLPGVVLDDVGREQAARLGSRLAGTALAAVVTSPLDRCRQTADAIADHPGRAGGDGGGAVAERHTEDRLGEARYGAWTGRPLRELAQEELWRQVQDQPSQVTFPPHPDHPSESMAQMQQRAVGAVREWDARVEQEHGPGAVWVAVSHGDVIKAVLADALGTELDRFQRIVVDPASISVLRLTPQRPFVLRVNDAGSDPVDLAGIIAAARAGEADAAVGGGAGSGPDGQAHHLQ